MVPQVMLLPPICLQHEFQEVANFLHTTPLNLVEDCKIHLVIMLLSIFLHLFIFDIYLPDEEPLSVFHCF